MKAKVNYSTVPTQELWHFKDKEEFVASPDHPCPEKTWHLLIKIKDCILKKMTEQIFRLRDL